MKKITTISCLMVILMFLAVYIGSRDPNPNPSGGEYMAINQRCICGSDLNMGFPMTDELWPFEYACGQCRTTYTINRKEHKSDHRER